MFTKSVCVAALAFLSCAVLSQSKTIGLKTEYPDELEKTYSLNADEPATEVIPPVALTTGETESNLDVEDLIDHELRELESALDKLAVSPVEEHHRAKRTIGFLTRLGSCMMTFMNNPTCWSRLTRSQMRREERRQLELQAEQLKREQEMYASALRASNGTDGNFTAPTMPPRPILTPTKGPSRIGRMVHSVRNTLSLLFPRLFGGLRQPDSVESSRFLLSPGNDI